MLAKQIQNDIEKHKDVVQCEYQMGGLSDGLYGDYASDVAIRTVVSLIETMIERLELQKNAFWKYSDKYEENNIATKTFHQVLDYEIDYLKAEKAIIEK